MVPWLSIVFYYMYDFFLCINLHMIHKNFDKMLFHCVYSRASRVNNARFKYEACMQSHVITDLNSVKFTFKT